MLQMLSKLVASLRKATRPHKACPVAVRSRLGLEVLEGRTLPSVSPLAFVGPVPSAVGSQVVRVDPIPIRFGGLSGYGSGTYSADPFHSIVSTDQLQGRADLTGLGQVTVKGTVSFELGGASFGTLTFTNAQGSVTVNFQKPRGVPEPVTLQKHAAEPIVFEPRFAYSYQVTGGTGAYKNFHGQGTLTLTLSEAAAPRPGHPSTGTFSLNMQAGRVIPL
jgi:hypothetical protein